MTNEQPEEDPSHSAMAEFSEGEPLVRFPEEDQKDQAADRAMRERFMIWMIGILIGQLGVVNLGVILLAILDKIKFEEWALQTWIAGTMIEVFGVVLVIANYLFPKRSKGEKANGSK